MAAENKPEGLKRIRNPERMIRIAVGYTGHAPPKSDDTDTNGEPGQLKIYLPKKLLECLPKCSSLPKERHRWNTNEEIAAYLITFEKHEEWLTTSPKTRPQNGSMILYNRKKVKYRKDGYCWKKRKDGKTTREDHMKLKVQGVECLYGCYVHSSIIPTFHRRCYWLLQNPDIVLVHYLNVPAVDDSGKPCGPVLCSINTDRKEWAKWSKEELIGQLKPMCAGSSLHQKCSTAKHRIISPKLEAKTGTGDGTGTGSGTGAGTGSGTEVQNSDVSEGQTEPSPGVGARSRGGGERKNGRLPKPSLLPQSSMEVSSTSTNQVEVPDTTQSSPLSITSDITADSPALGLASSLSQSSAAVFMSEVATVTGDSVYTTEHAHLIGSTHDATTTGILLAVAPDTQRFEFPGGVGLAEEGGELVLSSSLDAGGSGVNLLETSMNFDPDCFLNNPKQGQTYGGGGGKAEGGSCNGEGVLRCSPQSLTANGYVFNATLVNIKTEDTPLEQPLDNQSGYAGEGTGLSPSTTLEQMDFSAVMSSACAQSLAQQIHQHSPSLFLQASPKTPLAQATQPQICASETGQDSGETQAYLGLPTIPQTDSPGTNGDPHTYLHQPSPDQHGHSEESSQGGLVGLGSFPVRGQEMRKDQLSTRGPGKVTSPEKETQKRAELLLNPGEQHEAYRNNTGVGRGGEHYLQPTTKSGELGELRGQAGASAWKALRHRLGTSSLTSSMTSSLWRGVEGGAVAGTGGSALYTPALMPQEEVGEGQEAGAAPIQGSEVEQGTLRLLPETGRLFGVTDYSPEWSYPEGGVKVLITGPWLEASREYSCLFDHISVPAALIQPGVLRCYCPAHETGLVMLQVAMGGDVISSSVVFEYKARDLPALPSSQHDWLSLDDTQFRMSILERLEQMEQRMAEITNHHQTSETTAATGGVGGAGGTDHQSQLSPAEGSFEGRVVVVCEKMMTRPCWVSSNQLIHSRSSRGMTLLHLAAAQGYAGLIQTLIRWRTKHADSIDLELEVDPLNVDHFSCTPLMWACALGHTEAALVLYQWDPRALAIPDSLGRLPLSIARSRGHTRLAELLEQLQQTPPTQSPPTDTWMDRWSSESEPSGHRESPAPSSNPDLRRTRTEPQQSTQNHSQSQSWAHQGQPQLQGQHRGPPDNQGDLPPAKRLKLNPESQQQPVTPPRSQLPNLSPLNTHPPRPSSNSPNPHFPSPPLQGRLGGSGGGSRYSLRQALGRRSLARRILGKERLANHLRQRGVSTRGEEPELLTYQENSEDLQMNMMMLAEHIMEATPDRIKQEGFVATETETSPPETVGVSGDVSWLASYIGDVERFLYSRPQMPTPNPIPSPLSGPEDQESPLAPQGLPSPADWSSFLHASLSGEGPDTNPAHLTLTEAEQRELYEAARHAHHTLRKYKGRPIQEQRKETVAVVQRCYKKYKQLSWIALKYALYKRMTLAAILIQSRFRSFHEQRKFQQSRRAAVLIQQYYRSYRHSLSSLLTKRQNQAARKILRFLLRCRHRAREQRKARGPESPRPSPTQSPLIL
ncbi:calmodulin-binding transcription activator 1 [Salmo salar]|uniref:Calmodulin-binding transcription activator 1 n=1 Tax=Salmo salar TaxID=8030 RepID=A0ABM3DSK2_SALSA|nr:calmodulin-binding transcription activator 1-like [Salmo salar]